MTVVSSLDKDFFLIVVVVFISAYPVYVKIDAYLKVLGKDDLISLGHISFLT